MNKLARVLLVLLFLMSLISFLDGDILEGIAIIAFSLIHYIFVDTHKKRLV